MPDDTQSSGAAGPWSVPRRAPRFPLAGVLVTVVSRDGEEVLCAADALDISAYGLAMVLPEELDDQLEGEIDPGEEVLISFRLDGENVFARMPCRVVRRDEGVGAVEFVAWDSKSSRRLSSWLGAFRTVQAGFQENN